MKMPPCSESKNSQIWVLSGLIIAILATISSAYSQVLPQRDGRTPPHPSPGSGQLGPRNACSFPGADAGEQIMSAIKDLPEEGGIVDARCQEGRPVINSDMFSVAGQKPVTILLAAAVYTMNAKQSMSSGSRIIGVGRGTGLRATYIQNGKVSNDAMFLLGNSDASFGVELENFVLNCNASRTPGAPGYKVTGVVNTFAQERSWVRSVSFTKCNGAGLRVTGNSAQNSGPYSDLEFIMDEKNSLPDTTCVSIYRVPSFRGIQNVTCVSSRLDISPAVGMGFGRTNGVLENVHCEGTMVDCIRLGDAGDGTGDTGVFGMEVRNVYGLFQKGMTNLVHITSKSRAVCLSGLVKGNVDYGFTDDTASPPYHNAAWEVGLYCIGQDNPRTRISTDGDFRNIFAGGIQVGKDKPAIIGSNGVLVPAQYSCRNLPQAPNGSLIYCTDCAERRDPCSCGGNGALAVRQGEQWNCK